MLNKICTGDITCKITRDTVATVTIHTLAGSMSAIRAVTIVSVEREKSNDRTKRDYLSPKYPRV